MTERNEQSAFFATLEWLANQEPDVARCYAVPNGQYRPGEAMEPGLKAGVPDICCPIARGGYFGLYIELKHGDNDVEPAQRQWISALNNAGYLAVTAWEMDGAMNVLQNYLRQPRTVGVTKLDEKS